MTTAILIAILLALVFIARELRLLRRKGQPSETAKLAKYKPRIFTFERSGWADSSWRIVMWITFLIGMATWSRVESLLFRRLGDNPIQPGGWIYAIGMGMWACLCMIVLGVPIWGVVNKGMNVHDERVFKRVFNTEERDDLKSMAEIEYGYNGESQEVGHRRDSGYHEEVERRYREKGL